MHVRKIFVTVFLMEIQEKKKTKLQYKMLHDSTVEIGGFTFLT